jgi:tetratricopeptide (TPR) repeat protein
MSAFGIALLVATAAGDPGLALLEQARVALRAGDAKRAAVLARTALRGAKGAARDSIPLHREAQDVLADCGEGDGLVRFYDGLLRRDVSDPVLRYLRARVEPDAASRRRDLEGVHLASPDFFWAAYDLAEACAREGDWRRAARYAERAVELRPEEAACHNVLGHVLLEGSRFLEDPAERRALAERARGSFTRAIALAPESPEAYFNLGLVSFALNDLAEARRGFERAAALRPGFAEALTALGHVASREGRDDEAIAHYEKALDAEPGHATAHNNLAAAYYRRNDHARAWKHLSLAEAAGHAVEDSFKRAVVGAIEEEAFEELRRELERAPAREVKVFVPGREEPLDIEGALGEAVLGMAFRDSRGGVRLGERKVRGTVVARYVEAARIEIDLGGQRPPSPLGATEGAALRSLGGVGQRKRALIAVAREGAGGRRRKLLPWVADAGYRFSAHATELVGLVAPALGLELPGASEGPEPAEGSSEGKQ